MADKVIIEYDAEIRSMQAKLEQLIAKEKQLEKTGVDGQKQFQGELDKTGKNTDRLGNVFNKVGGIIAGAFAVGSLVQFGREVVDVTRKTELLQNQLNFVAGSVEGGNALFRQLQAEAKRLGIEFGNLAKGFTQFAVSSKQAGFTAQQSLEIYKQLAAGIRGSGASSQAAERAFYALEQMMSKGKVSSEELRQQMGEAIPGATALAAKAMGMTTAEFNKLLETGQIISADFIPKFAKAVNEEFAPALAGKTNSLDAAIQRANTQLENLKRNLGDSQFFANVTNGFTNFFERQNTIISSNVAWYEKLSRTVAEYLALGGLVNQNFLQEQVNLTQEQIEKDAQRQAGIEKQVASIMSMTEAERKLKVEELERIVLGQEAQKEAGEAGKLTIDILNQNKEILQGVYNEEEKISKERNQAAEQRKADESIFIRNAIALEQMRLLEAQTLDEIVQSRREIARLQLAAERLEGKKTAQEMKLMEAQLMKEIGEIRANGIEKMNARSGESTQESIEKEKEAIFNANNAKVKSWTKMYEEIDKIRQNFIEGDESAIEKWIEKWGNSASMVAGTIGGLFNDFAQTQNAIFQQQAQNQISNLESMLQAGLIAEEEYETRVSEVKRRAFEKQKEASIIDARIKAALSVLQLFTSLPFPAALALSPFVVALGEEQVNLIKSQSIPTFHEGGIDIDGSENKTSGKLKPDEFYAKMQKGETVFDREDTKQYMAEFKAMRDGRYEDYVAKHYVLPALKRSKNEPNNSSNDNATSMERAFQAAELVNAVKGNRVVRLHDETVDKIVGGIKSSSREKIINRRRFN